MKSKPWQVCERRKWRRLCFSFWYLTNFSMTAMIMIMSYWCFVRTTYWWSSYFQRKWRWTWSIGWNIKGKRYLQSLESLRDITEVTWNQSSLSKLYSVHIEQELSSKLLYCGFVGKFREIDSNRCAVRVPRILITHHNPRVIFFAFLCDFSKYPWNCIFLLKNISFNSTKNNFGFDLILRINFTKIAELKKRQIHCHANCFPSNQF